MQLADISTCSATFSVIQLGVVASDEATREYSYEREACLRWGIFKDDAQRAHSSARMSCSASPHAGEL